MPEQWFSGPQCTCGTSGSTYLENVDNNCLNAYKTVKLRYTIQCKNIGQPSVFLSLDVNWTFEKN